MNNNFTKKIVMAIAGLSIASSCAMMHGKEGHKCAAGKCSGKKSSTKEDSNKCGASNGCAAAKTSTKAKKQ